MDKIKVVKIGEVCSFCGRDYPTEDQEVGCCGEVRYELGYETSDGELVLESELGEKHEIVN